MRYNISNRYKEGASLRQTDYVILGLLGERPMSGYEIKKVVDIRFRFFWNESFGQIFPSLKRLLEEGLIAEAEAARRDPDSSLPWEEVFEELLARQKT